MVQAIATSVRASRTAAQTGNLETVAKERGVVTSSRQGDFNTVADLGNDG